MIVSLRYGWARSTIMIPRPHTNPAWNGDCVMSLANFSIWIPIPGGRVDEKLAVNWCSNGRLSMVGDNRVSLGDRSTKKYQKMLTISPLIKKLTHYVLVWLKLLNQIFNKLIYLVTIYVKVKSIAWLLFALWSIYILFSWSNMGYDCNRTDNRLSARILEKVVNVPLTTAL